MEQNWNLPDKPKRPRRRFWLKLSAGLLFAVVVYAGAYALLVSAAIVRSNKSGQARYDVPWTAGSWQYRVLHAATALARWIDRKLRPEFWRD